MGSPKRPRSKGKVTPSMVARAEILYRRGESIEKVVDYFLKRDGRRLGIFTPEQMQRFLYEKARGSRPNFTELFENKTPSQIEKSVKEWNRKREERAAKIRTSVNRRLSNPATLREVSERSKERMDDLQKDPTFRAKQSASARKTMKAWRNDPEGRRKHERVMQELRADPLWKQRRAESVSQGTYQRWLKVRIETMNKLIDSGALRVEEYKGNKYGKRRTRILVAGPPNAERTPMQVQRVQRAITRLSTIERAVVIQLFFRSRPVETVAKSLGQTPAELFKIAGPAYKKIIRAFRG